jgi:hypothetical protein
MVLPGYKEAQSNATLNAAPRSGSPPVLRFKIAAAFSGEKQTTLDKAWN